MKTLKIDDAVHRRLSRLKADMGRRSFSELLDDLAASAELDLQIIAAEKSTREMLGEIGKALDEKKPKYDIRPADPPPPAHPPEPAKTLRTPEERTQWDDYLKRMEATKKPKKKGFRR